VSSDFERLGKGIRLFEKIDSPLELLVREASGKPHVTHLTFRVLK
jgi:hypothetical protein